MSRFTDIIVTSCVALGALAVVSTVAADNSGPDMSVIRDASVKIDIRNAEGKSVGSCSGTVIDDPDLSDGEQVTILTAGHCTAENGFAVVTEKTVIGNRSIDGRKYFFWMGEKSKKADLAIYQGFGVPLDAFKTHASFYKGTVSFGDSIWMSGFPLGLPQDIRSGLTSFIESVPELTNKMGIESTECLRVAIPTSPGNSGSGVYKKTDNGYELIGVQSGAYLGGFSQESTIAWAVTIDNLQEFIANYGKTS